MFRTIELAQGDVMDHLHHSDHTWQQAQYHTRLQQRIPCYIYQGTIPSQLILIFNFKELTYIFSSLAANLFLVDVVGKEYWYSGSGCTCIECLYLSIHNKYPMVGINNKRYTFCFDLNKILCLALPSMSYHIIPYQNIPCHSIPYHIIHACLPVE